jgi:hypothetical protein
MTKNLQKFKAEKNLYFFAIYQYLSLGLNKRMPKLKEKPSALKKRTSSNLKHEISSLFSFFVSHFCPLGSGSGSAYGTRIHADPDPDTDPDPQP